MKTRRRSLQVRILSWAFAPLAIILLLVGLVGSYAYIQVTERQAIDSSTEMARLASAQLGARLLEFSERLTDAARAPDLYSGRQEVEQAALDRLAGSLVIFDGGVVVLDTRGQVSAFLPPAEQSDGVPFVAPGQDWSGEGFFQQVALSRRPVFDRMVRPLEPSGGRVVVAVPLLGQNSQWVGVLAGMFRTGLASTSSFYGEIVKLRIDLAGHAMLLDPGGAVLYDTVPEHVGSIESLPYSTPGAIPGGASAIRTTRRDGMEIIAAYAPVPYTPWALVIEQSWADLLAPANGYAWFLIFLLLLAAVVPAVVVTVAIRRVIAPVRQLTEATSAVAAGAVTGGGIRAAIRSGDELEELGASFNHMADQLALYHARMLRANRALHTISLCNQALVRAETENGLLAEVCQILIDEGGYRLAWVGYARPGEERLVEPVSFAGEASGYLDRIKITWGEGVSGSGPTGTAIRTGEYAVIRDTQADERFAPWREPAAQRGFASVIALPLRENHLVFGALTLYSAEKNIFDMDEILLLMELADDLAYGITALRLKESRARMAEALSFSEQKYRHLFESAYDAILILRGGQIIDCNPRALALFHCARGGLLGADLSACLPGGAPEDMPVQERMALAARGEPQVFEQLCRRADETTFDAEISLVRAQLAGGDGILAFVRDVTARRNADQELERYRHGLEELVKARTAELDRANAELLVAKEAAEDADRLKSAFLATMSHELRTPLNSIIGFTGVLLQQLPGPLNPEQTKQLGFVQASATHLLELINDILDISKIEAGQLDLVDEVFSLPTSCARVVQMVLPLAKKKSLPVYLEVDPSIGPVRGDRRRTEQVLINLLNNAIKFTEQGCVQLTCAQKEGCLVLSITDTGIGIPADQVNRIFKPFSQLDTGLTRKYEGTGLGLSISKRLVEMMGGALTVSSQYGEGSTFSAVLPYRPEETS